MTDVVLKTKGAQADAGTVAKYLTELRAMCDRAEQDGVVLTVDVVPLVPLAMGHHMMAPYARAAWVNG